MEADTILAELHVKLRFWWVSAAYCLNMLV
jgi:hypothetical protein